MPRFTRKDPVLPRGPIKLPPLKPDKISRRDRSESPRRTISTRSPLKTRLTFNENEAKLVVRQREDKDGGKGRRARDDGHTNIIMEQLDYRPRVNSTGHSPCKRQSRRASVKKSDRRVGPCSQEHSRSQYNHPSHDALSDQEVENHDGNDEPGLYMPRANKYFRLQRLRKSLNNIEDRKRRSLSYPRSTNEELPLLESLRYPAKPCLPPIGVKCDVSSGLSPHRKQSSHDSPRRRGRPIVTSLRGSGNLSSFTFDLEDDLDPDLRPYEERKEELGDAVLDQFLKTQRRRNATCEKLDKEQGTGLVKFCEDIAIMAAIHQCF
ncbi:Hypp8106 [Branchiostoma lanceolatum]|uniref:Hypp8106 protein n=1 Tax=Branchiostoma lanceolatum TaxID=7740 RepID=A0A8J9Z790_BRALA|nr:Hypp8106 [Branchiostoma lanceolatum]